MTRWAWVAVLPPDRSGLDLKPLVLSIPYILLTMTASDAQVAAIDLNSLAVVADDGDGEVPDSAIVVS